MQTTELVDPIVEAVRTKLLQRSQVGLKKYGIGLNRIDLNTLQWLIHAQEEAMDLANYLEVLIQKEQNKNKCLCTMSQKILGSGCEVCNPQEAIKYYRQTIEDLEQELKEAVK